MKQIYVQALPILNNLCHFRKLPWTVSVKICNPRSLIILWVLKSYHN